MNFPALRRLFVLAASVSLLPWCVLCQKLPRTVAYVSEQKGGVSIIDLNTLRVANSVQFGDTALRGISVARDGRYVVTADAATGDVNILTSEDLRSIRRVHVGDNPEFVRMHPNGKWCFVSVETRLSAAPTASAASAEGEARSEIVMLNTRDWSRERAFAAGNETEGIEFSPDGRSLVVANEGQNTLSVFDIATGERTREVDLARYGSRPRGVKASPRANAYAVTMEISATLLLLDGSFNVTGFVSTGAMPDGVSFDRQGRRIVVAASGAQKIQFFRAASLALLGEVSVGQRCWHFTFTPDDSKLLAACGRSNDVYVIDAKTYRITGTLSGFRMPWGIVTYPHAFGSLDLP